jgi:hypothetical protein
MQMSFMRLEKLGGALQQKQGIGAPARATARELESGLRGPGGRLEL